MPIKRTWLKALLLSMLGLCSFGGGMNPQDIENLLHIMNETKVEFTIPDEDHKDDDFGGAEASETNLPWHR